jgi:site-specific DNA-cytosine methylase
VEFFAGIGGFATAWPGCRVELAIDINQLAASTYRRNHSHPFLVTEIESLNSAYLNSYPADLWWLSPPCQPYTRRGRGRDLVDPRARSLVHLLTLIASCRPPRLALENVLGFAESKAFACLLETLNECGYRVQTLELCPTQLGWPNRRPRFYVLASQSDLTPWRAITPTPVSLGQLGIPLEVVPQDSDLWLRDDVYARFQPALDRVHACELQATTACFASSYGKALIRSGSYLHDSGRYRRFTPREVARLLGYPDQFKLDLLSPRQAWKLLGNSLSIPAIRFILSHFPPPLRA